MACTSNSTRPILVGLGLDSHARRMVQFLAGYADLPESFRRSIVTFIVTANENPDGQ